MNRVLIVGYGYLGEAIDKCFVEAGWEVIRVGRTVAANVEIADVTSKESLLDLARRVGSVDAVIHCASSGRGGVEAYQAVFEQGIENLIAVFKEAHLIFTSSSSVYAQTHGEIVTEESEANPTRETGQILLRSEKKVIENQGTVMRLSGIYGDGRSVILKRFLSGGATLEEDGRRVLNQIHRADAAKAYLVAAEKKLNGIYNISETNPKSQLETLSWLCRRFKKDMPESVPRDLNRKRGWTHKIVSNRKILAAGWSPQYETFTEAVEDIYQTIDLLD